MRGYSVRDLFLQEINLFLNFGDYDKKINMVYFSLLVVFVYFLKKYLDHQDNVRRSAQHYIPREGAVEYGSEAYYDQYSHEHYDLLVKCLIFCTYTSEQFKPIEENLYFGDIGDDLKSLFHEERMESLFRNQLVERSLSPKLLYFKEVTSRISYSEWLFDSVDVDHDERWKTINRTAEELLTEMNVKERGYDFSLYKPR